MHADQRIFIRDSLSDLLRQFQLDMFIVRLILNYYVV